jgi:hypothetical protein
MDLLRVGRARLEIGLRLPDHLCRSDPDDRIVHAARAADRAARQEPEHHVDRRLHRRALRQASISGGACGADRDRRNDPVYRAAAESRVSDVRDRVRTCGAGLHAERARRHRASGGAGDGSFRDPVRHPAYRCDRTSGRPDAGDRDRIHRQARGISRGRVVRHLLDVRRPGRSVLARAGAARHRRGADHGAEFLDRDRDDAAVDGGDHPAAAAIPCDGGGEPFGSRDQARALAVPALSRADQSVRGADCTRRPAHLPAGPGRQRHVRAGAAALRQCVVLHNCGFHRWPVGGDRDGDRGIGRTRDHGVERSGGALLPEEALATHHWSWRCRRIAAADPQDCDLPDPGARLSLLSRRR